VAPHDKPASFIIRLLSAAFSWAAVCIRCFFCDRVLSHVTSRYTGRCLPFTTSHVTCDIVWKENTGHVLEVSGWLIIFAEVCRISCQSNCFCLKCVANAADVVVTAKQIGHTYTSSTVMAGVGIKDALATHWPYNIHHARARHSRNWLTAVSDKSLHSLHSKH